MTGRITDVCGEIEYDGNDGRVHSDICVVHNGEYVVKAWVRDHLHAALDEWLDKSNGTGLFWVGDPREFHRPRD